jgi:sodium-dependent dicarboxylate transporter 2/3/5
VFLLLLIVAICGVLLTMFASNTASAAILLPLLAPMADSLGIAVLPLILLVALSVSLDFTAPMGTPPNTLAYSTGLVNIKTMAKTGLLLSVLSCLVLAVYLRVISGFL